MKNEIIYIIATSIHSIASVIWTGGLFFLVLTFFPVMKKIKVSIDNETFKKTIKKFTDLMFDRLTVIVIISLIFIIISGLIQRKFGAIIYEKEYSSTYKILHLIKFILTGLMVIFIGLRQYYRKKSVNEKKIMFPVIVNSFLAFLILIISAIMKINF